MIKTAYTRACARATTKRSLFTIATLAIVVAWGSTNPATAQRTITEELLRREIVRLGGEWEGDNAPSRIGFSGPGFSQDHFEMLEHIRGTQMLTLVDIDLGPKATKSLGTVKTLKRLYVERCRLAQMGYDPLNQLTALASLEVYDCDIPLEFIGAIAKLETLKSVVLVDAQLPMTAIEELSKIRKLERLQVYSSREFSALEIERLRSRLPSCKVDIRKLPSK